MLIKDVLKGDSVGSSIIVQGWLRSVRNSKSFSFLVLNDGSTQKDLQIVVSNTINNYEEISSLGVGASLEVYGKLVESQGKSQSFEIQAEAVKILGKVTEDYPLQKKGTSLEYLREIAHLRCRTNTFGAIARIRNNLSFATHEFFQKEGFLYLHTPIITTSDAEGAGAMFQVTTLDMKNIPKDDKGNIDYSKDYFGAEAKLTVSGQLEAETYAVGLGRVYTFGPTFRAENSNTPRHLSEFWMIEPEMSFADLNTIADLATKYIKFLINKVLERSHDELEFCEKMYRPGLIDVLKHVVDSHFERITYTRAIEILEEANAKEKFEFKPSWGADLQTEHEKFLTEKHFKKPVIVTDYPKEIKAFYMKLNPDHKTVAAMDILLPYVGEIIGASQREDDYDLLVSRIKEMGQNVDDYSWYLDLRKYGSVPHSGFGLGLERMVMYVTGMTNIRDTIPYPRTPKNAKF